MKIRMLRDCGGKAAGTIHDLTPWAARNFLRMRAAKQVCDRCGKAPANIDRHDCKALEGAPNRAMPLRGTR